MPEGPIDERFVYLSDVLPTAWQAVEYAAIPGVAGLEAPLNGHTEPGTVAVFGLGPIGQMCCRIALHRGAREVFGIDLVPERLEMARRHGVHTVDAREHGNIGDALRELTGGRGPDSVIDAVGMEAHGAPFGKLAHTLAGLLPDAVAAKMIEKGGVDRLSVLHAAIDAVRRGGTISLSGVYGGMVDPMPLMDMFDKQLQLRMGQANVKRWIDDLMPLVCDDADPLGVEDLATHKLPLDEAPHAYEIFQKKQDGAIKILLTP